MLWDKIYHQLLFLVANFFIMKNLICYLILLFTTLWGVFPIETKAQSLPENWFGNWHGDLEIYQKGKPVDTIPMSLEIFPVDTVYSYILTYNVGNEKQDRREYQLVFVDEYHFVLDENNGIFIDTYLVDSCLISHFEVMGSKIFTRICLHDDTIYFEISGFGSDVNISGGISDDDQNVPEVIAYPLGQVTRALLRRMENEE